MTEHDHFLRANFLLDAVLLDSLRGMNVILKLQLTSQYTIAYCINLVYKFYIRTK